MRWDLRGTASWVEHFQPAWKIASAQRSVHGEVIDAASIRVYHKGSRLKPSAGRRHALRRYIAGIQAPRIAEFENLTWLRQNDFGAPEPLCAAVHWAGIRPIYQALVTRFVDTADTLADLLQQGHLDEESSRSLGAEVARLHQAGFVHRDLFARNLLLQESGRWIFLDAWRGGTRRGSRGPLWDLACLLEDVGEAHADSMLRGYTESGAELDLSRLEREIQRVRRRYSAR